MRADAGGPALPPPARSTASVGPRDPPSPCATIEGAVQILYHDDDLVVVNKPSGMIVHRGWANDRVVVMTAVRDLLGQWVYPVHRLDRGASGALALALSPVSAAALAAAFAAGRVGKRYIALVRGIPPERGVVDHPIPKRPGGPRVPAVTEYERLAEFERYSLVAAMPRTGRLHQVRRHLKHLSCPIIGDVNYGKGEHNRLFRERFGLHRLALHCSRLELPHPRIGDALSVHAPVPPDLADPLARMGLASWCADPPPQDTQSSRSTCTDGSAPGSGPPTATDIGRQQT